MKKIFVCSVFTLVLLSGCGFGGSASKVSDVASEETGNELAEKLIEGNSGIDIEISQEGEAGVAWPAGISLEVPEFKYGKLEVTFDGSKTEANTLIQIKNVEADAFSKYAKDLRAKGWQVEDNVLKDYGLEGVRLEATKGDLTLYLDKDPVGENTAFLSIEKFGQISPIE
ncbi:MAG: hypothetical protein Q8P62_03835 [Candidatus Peregrinibacteria bacterium]|nr:hypothetical protein [Candidatus Peregrinibacteria bacterium]